MMHRSARRRATLCFCGVVASLGLVNAELLPETELITNCYNFPEEIFNRDNSVKNTYGSSPHLMRDTGAAAVDFTLHDTDGNRWNLGEVLEAGAGKPVVMIFGMATCPAFQGLDSKDSGTSWTYWDEYALVEQYGDQAIFVNVYGPEPHPASPDLNFDSGMLLPNFWSVYRQSNTYDDRVAKAKNIRSMIHPDEVILPDYLTGNPYSSLNQPVWCTYANAARSSVMIASSGRIFYQQAWLSTENLAEAIDGYWAQDGAGTWTDDEDIPRPLSKVAYAAKANRKPPPKATKGSRSNRDPANRK